MDTARVKKLIAVDTVAGKTNVLLTTIMDDPALVFVFAPGGDGTLMIEASADGTPFTNRVRNPAYFFAPNLSELPFSWEPQQAKAPIMFITHENDDCGIQYRRLPISTLTKRAAGNSFPPTVIKSPSPGNHQECFAAPTHAFSPMCTENTPTPS